MADGALLENRTDGLLPGATTAKQSKMNRGQNGRQLRLLFFLAAIGAVVVPLFALMLGQLPHTIQVTLSLDLRAAVALSVVVAVLVRWRTTVTLPQKPETFEPEATEEPALEPTMDADNGVLGLPWEVLRSLVSVRTEADDDQWRGLKCPVCDKIMLQPQGTECGHHACAACLRDLAAQDTSHCPTCSRPADLRHCQPPSPQILEALSRLPCACAVCEAWEGMFINLCDHLPRCQAVQSVVALRHISLASREEQRRVRALLSDQSERLRADMAGASPSLVHCFSAEAMQRETASSPIFSACGRLWILQMHAQAGEQPPRHFLVLPHDHSDGLRYRILFAKRGEGFKERLVDDWPEHTGQGGALVLAQELEGYVQVDGSLFLLIHAEGLCDVQRSPGSPSP